MGMAMLEFVFLGLARWLRIDWLFWYTDGGLTSTIVDEQRQRQHNRSWARGFLDEKRLEREQQTLKLKARASESVNQPQLGRPGSRRTR
jgi:hypothetical protein